VIDLSFQLKLEMFMQLKAAEAKQLYLDKIEAQLEKLEARIDELRAKTVQAKATAKIKYYDKIEALTAKQKEAEFKLQVLKSTSEDAWQRVKVDVESALHELQNAFNDALAQFKQSDL
jgi:predicted  nucleic acid-binding Zn-ribbon protein